MEAGAIIVLTSCLCPLMDENKRTVNVSWWERQAVGKNSCSGGQDHAQYIFNPVFYWWVGLCSLSVCCLAWDGPVLESTGSMVGLKATPKRTYANMGLLVLLFPVPVSLQQVTTNPYLCRRPSDTCRQVWFSLLWGHCSFPVVPGARKVLFVPPRSICLP